MDSVDWGQIVAAITVIGMYTHMVIEWIKVKHQLKQIRYHLTLDEDGNPPKDTSGKVRRTIDSDVVREIVRNEMKPTIPIKGDSA